MDKIFGSNQAELKRNAVVLLFLILFSGIILYTRIHFAALPLDCDEGTYAYIAWRMDSGEMPYRDYYDHKPPVIYFLYNAAFKMFGVNYTAIRGFAALYAVLIMLAVFAAGQRYFGPKAGLFAAALFSFYQGSVFFQGINANTEIFLLLPLVLAFYFSGGTGKKEYFLSGLFFSAAVFTKPAVIFGALLWAAYWLMKKNRQAFIMFVAGVFSFCALIAAWLAVNKLMEPFTEYVLKFNVFYAQVNSNFRFPVLIRFLAENILLVLSWFFMLIAALKKTRTEPVAFLFLLCAGLIAGIISLRAVNSHYYLVLYAPLCISAGAMIADAAEGKKFRIKTVLQGALFVFLFTVFLAFNAVYYRIPLSKVSEKQYGYSYFYETQIIAEKINMMKNSDSTLFVWPSNPEIFFYTGIKSPFKMISAMPAFVQRYPEKYDALLGEAEALKPDFAVVMTRFAAPFKWVLDDYSPVMTTKNFALFEKGKK